MDLFDCIQCSSFNSAYLRIGQSRGFGIKFYVLSSHQWHSFALATSLTSSTRAQASQQGHHVVYIPDIENDNVSDSDDEPSTPTPARVTSSNGHQTERGNVSHYLRLPLQTPIPSLFPSPGQLRAQSLPPISSDGLIWSSPIVGTKQERLATIRRKSQKKRATTLTKAKDDGAAERRKVAEEAELKKTAFFNDLLSRLVEQGYSFGQFMLHVFDPQFRQGVARYAFFRDRSLVRSVLDFWVLRNNCYSETGSAEVRNWAVGYVSGIIKHEARAITRADWLQTLQRPINVQFVLSFDMSKIHMCLQESATTAMKVLEAFAIGPSYAKASLQRIAKKKMVC
jgi:hypothetical protein